jgi:hypothetical protein
MLSKMTLEDSYESYSYGKPDVPRTRRGTSYSNTTHIPTQLTLTFDPKVPTSDERKLPELFLPITDIKIQLPNTPTPIYVNMLGVRDDLPIEADYKEEEVQKYLLEEYPNNPFVECADMKKLTILISSIDLKMSGYLKDNKIYIILSTSTCTFASLSIINFFKGKKMFSNDNFARKNKNVLSLIQDCINHTIALLDDSPIEDEITDYIRGRYD